MYKNFLIAIGITILFLGLAIQPSVATVQPKEEIDITPNVDDVEELVAQLRVAINEKLEKYESIPKVADIWEIILNLLNLIVKTVKQFFTIVKLILLFPIALMSVLFFIIFLQ